MKTVTICIALIMLSFSLQTIYAQDSIVVKPNSEKIETLIQLKERIKKEERDFLKSEVETVNQRLDKGEISQEEANRLKKEYADDWVMEFVDGDGKDFDWGWDIHECGIQKAYKKFGGEKYLPFILSSNSLVHMDEVSRWQGYD